MTGEAGALLGLGFINNAINTAFQIDTANKNYKAQQDATAWNKESWQKSFDYNKALTEMQMEREDTAVQRRMADMAAAGINPNLAAGSAAQSSAGVAAHSGTVSAPQRQSINIGQVLDTLRSVQELRNSEEQNKIMQKQNAIMANAQTMSNYDVQNHIWSSMIDNMSQAYMLGYDPENLRIGRNKNGQFVLYALQDDQRVDSITERAFSSSNPLFREFNARLNSAVNAADMLQKENSLYYFNQFMDVAKDVANTAVSGYNAKSGRMRAEMPFSRYQRPYRQWPQGGYVTY